MIKYNTFIRELGSYLQATFGSAFRESSNSTHFKTCSSEPRAEHAVIKMVNLSIWVEKQRNPHTLGSISKCLLYHAKHILNSKIPNLFPSHHLSNGPFASLKCMFNSYLNFLLLLPFLQENIKWLSTMNLYIHIAYMWSFNLKNLKKCLAQFVIGK